MNLALELSDLYKLVKMLFYAMCIICFVHGDEYVAIALAYVPVGQLTLICL